MDGAMELREGGAVSEAPGPSTEDRLRQELREKAQREAALGQRARAILAGDLGPVLKRWVTGTIGPTSQRVSDALTALLAGDSVRTAQILESPVFGLMQVDCGPRSPLRVIAQWAAKGDNLNDFVLGVLGSLIVDLARDPGGASKLTRVLCRAGENCREIAIGQFITQVQGAKAMMRVRTSGKESWQQKQSMEKVAELLAGQARAALLGDHEEVNGRSVISVTTAKGDVRRLELRAPEPEDWDLLRIARWPAGEKDASLGTWASLAMLIVCAAQAEAGWFALGRVAPKPGHRGPKRTRDAHGIMLSEDAAVAIARDLDKWMGLGFTHSPMVIEPVSGDYLTVKHRKVAGGRGPKGMRTDPTGTTAWEVASNVISATPWKVPWDTLRAIRDEGGLVAGLVEKAMPDPLQRETTVNAYRTMAAEAQVFFPIFMDFRGRVYLRTNPMTYQGGDLHKSLLVFGGDGAKGMSSSKIRALAMMAGNLYGNGMDKAPMPERVEWFQNNLYREALIGTEPERLLEWVAEADEPLQFYTLLSNLGRESEDSIPCQLDGTCNGLQHLSALFRDHTAAPFVNLTGSSVENPPEDLYARVAIAVGERLRRTDEPWARRLLAAVKIDRKLCKGPVMVLPYGGTRKTIEEQVHSAILKQGPKELGWTRGLIPEDCNDYGVLWPDWLEGNYAAFVDRPLETHPLLALDARRLGGFVWEAIEELLPKPMAAMEALRKIARWVGDRELCWSTEFGAKPLWVVQAKAKSASRRMAMQGFQLPGSVRGLQIRQGSDEVDPGAHVTGIVANLIHSLDARHLVATAARFYADGGRGLGTIHDGFITRPSQVGLLGKALRSAFLAQYDRNPLSFPVRVGPDEVFESWYALAEAAGASFPEFGEWDPREVLGSAWVFS